MESSSGHKYTGREPLWTVSVYAKHLHMDQKGRLYYFPSGLKLWSLAWLVHINHIYSVRTYLIQGFLHSSHSVLLSSGYKCFSLQFEIARVLQPFSHSQCLFFISIWKKCSVSYWMLRILIFQLDNIELIIYFTSLTEQKRLSNFILILRMNLGSELTLSKVKTFAIQIAHWLSCTAHLYI